MTIGSIVIQDTAHDPIQCETSLPPENVAIAEAMADVMPDWMMPKIKWLWR